MKLYIPYYLITALLLVGLCCPKNCLSQTKFKSTLGMAFVPNLNQNKEQQDKDDLECHRVAKEQTGIDPVYLPDALKNTSKKNKVITVSRIGKAPDIPTESGIEKKKRKRMSAEPSPGKKRRQDKREAKARAKALETEREEKIMEYKEVYVSCMQEKGYRVW